MSFHGIMSIKQIVQRQHNDVQNSKLEKVNQLALFTCDAGKPHSGLPRTNPATGQGGPGLSPLGHVASTYKH